MSSLVLPSLQGLTWPIGRTTSFRTLTDVALSKRVATVGLQIYATYTYNLVYSLLRDDIATSDVKALVGLFNSCRGRFDSFLYTDPVWNTVAAEPFGFGDGTTTAFQIIATFKNTGGASAPDIVQNFNGVPTVFNNGVDAFGTYTLGPTGIVTFTTAPIAGHALTWTGSFYQRCHFLQDTFQVHQFMNKWWEATALGFKSVLL